MQEWMKISALLCSVGFMREYRPSEPFLTEYLLGPWHNITDENLNRDVYPMSTYAYLAQLVIVFLITDFFALIITMGVMGIVVWSMLLWTYSLEAVITLEFFYGTYMAVEVAYYTYIYAKVDKKYYNKVTSHTRAAIFAGKMVACISAQLLYNLKVMNFRSLNYLSLGSQVIATALAIALPRVNRSLYFHRESYAATSPVIASIESVDRNSLDEKSDASVKAQMLTPFKLLWLHFRNAYTNVKVLQWSIWYAIGLCGYLQVASYVQLMWKSINPTPDMIWNAGVDAVFTALAALFALLAGYIHTDRLKPLISLLILAILTALEGGAILMICWTQNIYVSYAGYIIFGALYGFIITVVGTEVARQLEEDSFGLVFGFNTTIALVLETILTAIVTPQSMGLSVSAQFTIYAFYFIVVGIFYLVAVIIEYLRGRGKHTNCSD